MGLQTYFLAVSPMLLSAWKPGFWKNYLRRSSDILPTIRGEAKMQSFTPITPSFFRSLRDARSRTICYWKTLSAKHAKLPVSLFKFIASHQIEVIHCNHYFNLSIADEVKNLSRGAKVICETHDIQSRHLIVSDPLHPMTKAQGNYESYFEDELACCNTADEFIHLNKEEYETFVQVLPSKKHHLVYPSLPRPVVTSVENIDIDFLIVASANLSNYKSVCWFLDEVWDDELNSKAILRIVGNIDSMFQGRQHKKYKRFGKIFAGRVDDVAEWYSRTKIVLAPAIEGQGISIKTVEALSYGKPLLYSPLALRGFSNLPELERLNGLCGTVVEFKDAIYNMLSKTPNQAFYKSNTVALKIFEKYFSSEAYQKRIAEIY
jgi:polysaccharide biosynthesis protein PslH